MKFYVWVGVFSTLFFAVFGLCPSGWTEYGDNCYFMFETPVDRHDAELVCKRHQAYLASLRDDKEKSVISELLKLSTQRDGETGAWSGRKRIPATWVWEEQHDAKDGDEESKTKDKVIFYGIYVRNGSVVIDATVSATRLHPFCKRKWTTVDKCDNPSGWMFEDGECYKMFKAAPPDSIPSTCQSNNADVFTPLRQRDMNLLAAVVPQNQTIWANGKRTEAGSNRFKTDYGGIHTYVPWLQDPSWNITKEEDCLAVAYTNVSTGFLTVRCDDPASFICITPQGACPLGWYQIDQGCYRWHLRPEDKVTWAVAKDRCLQEASTMLEPNIISPTLKNFLNQKLMDSGIDSVWLQSKEPETSHTKGNKSEAKTHELCGFTDFDSQKSAEYCFGSRNYICTMEISKAAVAEKQVDDECPEGWNQFYGRCFKFLSGPSNQIEAISRCEKENATLPIVRNDLEQSFVAVPAIINSDDRSLWLGVSYRTDRYYLQNGDEVHYANGAASESRDQSCIYVKAGSSVPKPGIWLHGKCNEEHGVLCVKNAQKVTVSVDEIPYGLPVTWSHECGPGWLYNNKTDVCYWVEKYVLKTWQEARLTCQTMSSELLSVENLEEQEYVSSLLLRPDYYDVSGSLWIGIGGGDDGNASEWAWSDQTSFEFTHWHGDQPTYNNKQCVKIPCFGDFHWKVADCHQHSPYICKKYAHLRGEKKNPTETPESIGPGLSTGAITGIVVVLIIIVCIAVGLVVLCKKRFSNKSEEYEDMENKTSENDSTTGQNGTGNNSKPTEDTGLSPGAK